MQNESSQVLWSEDDCRKGWCSPEQIGSPVETQLIEQPMPAEPPVPEQLSDVPREFVYEFELADYHRDRAAYRAKGGNVLALIKIGQERQAAQSARAATLAQLSATRLRGMDDQDILLAFCNGLFAEADEVRDRILARMGIDIKELMELLEQSD